MTNLFSHNSVLANCLLSISDCRPSATLSYLSATHLLDVGSAIHTCLWEYSAQLASSPGSGRSWAYLCPSIGAYIWSHGWDRWSTICAVPDIRLSIFSGSNRSCRYLWMVAEALSFHKVHTQRSRYRFLNHKANLSIFPDMHSMVSQSESEAFGHILLFSKHWDRPASAHQISSERRSHIWYHDELFSYHVNFSGPKSFVWNISIFDFLLDFLWVSITFQSFIANRHHHKVPWQYTNIRCDRQKMTLCIRWCFRKPRMPISLLHSVHFPFPWNSICPFILFWERSPYRPKFAWLCRRCWRLLRPVCLLFWNCSFLVFFNWINYKTDVFYVK